MSLAAVCTALGEPLEVMDLELAAPRAGEVRVRIGAAGICASDVSVRDGKLPSPLPIVLGHEAAGTVTAVGPGVTTIHEGDHVVIAAMPQCGECFRCARGQHSLCEQGDPVLRTGALLDGTTRLRAGDGRAVHQMVATGTFAEEVVVPVMSVVRIPSDVPFVPASLIGCGVLTGAGSALNAASIRPDDTVVVIGCGSVGLAALQGARLAGAGRLIAVDVVPAKLKLAADLGAAETIDSREQDAVAAIRDLTDGRGADVVIECVGVQPTVDAAIRMTGKGGEVVFVGAGGPDVRIDVRHFGGLVGSAKTFRGVLFGSAEIQRDVTRIVEAYKAGSFELDRLVSRTFTLEEVNAGIAALGAGDVVSAVIEFN
ncbi:NDMA-dependent alcohol dehydrogenase [Paraconexibacter sp. AEG42_29]|uniref:NDMA-dependent alcohol dehydrogenase n=2 Tax=Paraconexibacter sp. AEG42_29 TaxID=2997339 RepID=A0AAU7B3R8_9ACTN